MGVHWPAILIFIRKQANQLRGNQQLNVCRRFNRIVAIVVAVV